MSTLTIWAAAQRAAGVLAAHHRDDPDAAQALLDSFPDEASKVNGFRVLTELSLTLVRTQTGQSMDDLLQELSVHLAQADEALPGTDAGKAE